MKAYMTVAFWIVGYDVRILVYVRTFAMNGKGKQTVIKVWPFKGFANKIIQSLGVIIHAFEPNTWESEAGGLP